MSPHAFFIQGSPATFATRREGPWRACLTTAPKPCLADQEQGLWLDFNLASNDVQGQRFDLDNLCEVVFSVIVGKIGWFGGRRQRIRWWSATRRVAQPSGCMVTVHAGTEHRRPTEAPLVSGTYSGPLPRNARGPELAEWAKSFSVKCSAFDRVVLGISFGQAVNIGDIATGRVKAVIDCLYPWIGGASGAPDDDRITALFVEQEAQSVPPGSVAISMWGHTEETPATDVAGGGLA